MDTTPVERADLPPQAALWVVRGPGGQGWAIGDVPRAGQCPAHGALKSRKELPEHKESSQAAWPQADLSCLGGTVDRPHFHLTVLP